MSRRPRILFLVNWTGPGNWPFRDSIADRVDKADVLHASGFDGTALSRLNRYSLWGSEFYLPFRALRMRSHYDAIVSWSLRTGMVYGMLNRIPSSRGKARHVVQDFHINPLRTDPAYALRLRLSRASQPGIDLFLCTSSEEEDLYARSFGIPRQRLRFLPQSPPLHYLNYPHQHPRSYIFAYGNSDRDYDTLIAACRNLGTTAVILSQQYTPAEPLPSNVVLIRTRKPESELMGLASRARLVVLPLQDYRIPAGQLSMLEAMALGRPLVITSNMATREYAAHGQTAHFYRAGDVDELESHIRFLLDNKKLAEEMGGRAREASRTLHERRVCIFLDVLDEMLA